MLISFSVSNWRLFKEEVTFSMVASSEKQNKETVSDLPSVGIKVLPIAAIYGGNASGKTSLIKAMAFVKQFVVRGTLPGNPINTIRFKLDPVCLKKPSKFKIEFSVEKKCYEYSFAVDNQMVVEEKLVQILKTTDKELYSRNLQKFKFHTTLRKDQRLKFVSEGTRENQLFLTNSINQNIQHQHVVFKSIYDWFKETLTIIEPGTRYLEFEKLIEDAGPLSDQVNKILPNLDMGLSRLQGKSIPIDDLNLPPDIQEHIRKLPEKSSMRINIFGEMFIITNESGGLAAKKLMAIHRSVGGEDIQFDMREESDGTRRIIDLLPMFIDLASQKLSRVYFVDEIDRSFHTELLIQLLEFFLDSCSAQGKTQLIFTTHNLLTMDQDLLRRDEMWVTDRNQGGSASLISFGEYKDIRKDKDIRKSYRQGRLGGFPKVNLNFAVKDDESERKKI